MKITVTENRFIDEFRSNPERKDSFSLRALQTLFAHIDEVYDDDDELDIVALDGEWAEYTPDELRRQYCQDELDSVGEVLAWLELQTAVLRVTHYSPLPDVAPTSFLVQEF